MALDLNTPPYFDDFDETKGFHRVLFRPGFAVQTRELNQLQSILQQQIETHGSFNFTEGSQVVPGNLSINTNADFVRLDGQPNVTPLIGESLIGAVSGLKAFVSFAVNAEGGDPSTLFVEYENSGDDTETKEFIIGEALLDSEGNNRARVATSGATGKGSTASIETGYYFTKGVFVRVEAQTIVLDKYSNTPTYKIGLNVVEDIVTSSDDESLNDNAAGSFNFAAPGAHRWRLTPILEKRDIGTDIDEEEFIVIHLIIDGVINNNSKENTYSILERTLARRTFDQAGNYTVRSFGIDVREFRNNFRGDWQPNTLYLAGDIVETEGKFYVARLDGTSTTEPPTVEIGTSQPSITGVVWVRDEDPLFNRGVFDVVSGESAAVQRENKDKFAIGLEPGKAYVNGFEIDKVGTEFLPVEKARTTQTQTNTNVITQIGNFVVVDNVNSLPDVSQFPLVSLRDEYTGSVGVAAGDQVGTARVRIFEYDSGSVGTSGARYKLSLFDINIDEGKSFSRDVKQVFIDGGQPSLSFSADIRPITSRLTGSVSASNSTTVTGAGTLFNVELKVGDYIEVDGERYRVDAIASNNEMTIESTLTASNEVFSRLGIRLEEVENEALLFGLPYTHAKTIRNENDNSNTAYFATQKFEQFNVPVDSGSGFYEFSLTVNAPEFFAGITDLNYTVLNNSTGQIESATLSFGNTTRTLNVIVDPDGATAPANFTVFATVRKFGAGTEKTKTLVTGEDTFLTESQARRPSLRLTHSDGYELLKVLMDTGDFDNPTGDYEIDITDRYFFDDGQRITHYDRSRLLLQSGQPSPIAPIKVIYEYFQHSAAGDHFTVNSYLNAISYDDIPFFGEIPLAWVLDFRPRVADGTDNFVSSTRIPKRNQFIQLDFQYYVARKDKIALSDVGQFFRVAGSPDLIPSYPNDPSEGMVIYNLEFTPYNFTEDDLSIEKIDNSRYTMRDIGRLEKRIENVEYYTALSLLEKSAESLSIRDAEGFDRFKNGFVVDNFTTQAVGDVESPDFSCSIDMENGELRPFYYMDNVNLVERGIGENYQVSGDLITLPYQEVDFIQQLDASRTENVNPFAIFTFIGSTTLTPNTDEWFEVNRLPDIVENVDNFSAVRFALESSGALGTVWNAWQNTWAGTPVVSTNRTTETRQQQRQFLFFRWTRTQRRTVTTTTTSQQIGQQREGVRTSVVPVVSREVKSDRVVSTAMIPYIRSRAVVYTVRGLKPETTFTPFFDSVNISNFIQPATQITIDKNRGFDVTSRASGDSDQIQRITQSGNSDTALEVGDVLFVSQRNGAQFPVASTSPSTAVVVMSSDDFDNDQTVLHVVNIKGTGFQEGDVVTGTLSGETATIQSAPVTPDRIVTNTNGEVAGLFKIPNTTSNRFRTGTREFKLSDDPQDGPARTSTTRAQYTAEGVIETRQRNVTATRNAEVRQESLIENRVVNRITRTQTATGWSDPLAQTFLIDSKGGAFLTSVDIFFASKSQNIPVRLQVREVVNGYPGSAILPFSEVVLPPEDVNISTNVVEDADGQIKNAPIATTFKFSAPVYVQEDTEYCVVLLADTNDYNVWISQLGERSVVNNRIISEQPYMGVLFKSQNASTWTADQYQDLMFNLKKAKFNTNVVGQVDLSNADLTTTTLERNPFFVRQGSNRIRVFQRNHGFVVNSPVIISNAPAFAGFTEGQINRQHSVVSADFDSYIISVGGFAQFTGSFGGEGIRATKNVQYNSVQPIVQQLSFEDTQINYLMRTMSGRGVHSTDEQPYQFSEFFPVVVNDTNRLQSGQMIITNAAERQIVSRQKSVILRTLLQSSNENISPVVDLQRLSLIAIRDKIDSPTGANINDTGLDSRLIATNTTEIGITNNNRFVTTNTVIKERFANIDVGKFVVTSNFADGANNGAFKVTAVDPDGDFIEVEANLVNAAAGVSVNMTLLDRFVDEIAPVGGSSASKYVTRKITFENPATFLKIRFAASVEQQADVEVYFKTEPLGTRVPFEDIPYVKADPNRLIVKSDGEEFRDVEFDIQGLPEYDAVQIKIVMKSTFSTDIVRIKDLIIIGCA
jgi:hypothetical protein